MTDPLAELQKIKVTCEDLRVERVKPDDEAIDMFMFYRRDDPSLSFDLKAQEKMVQGMFDGDSSLVQGVHTLASLESTIKSYTELRRYIGISKAPKYIEHLVRELKTNKPNQIIFAYHKDTVRLLEYHLESNGIFFISIWDGTPANKKQRLLERLRDRPKYQVAIISSNAVGIKLDGYQEFCQHVDIFEPHPTPSKNAEAVGTLHRIGQTKDVFARFICIAASVDEKISRLYKNKAKEYLKIKGESTHE